MKTPSLIGTVAATALLLNFAGVAALRAQSPAPSPEASPSKPAAEVSPSPSTAPTAAATEPHIGKRMLEKYDTNKNGTLDADEKAAMEKDRIARRAERLRKYDKNNDGKLDDTEKAAMKADRDKERAKAQEK